MPWAGFMASSCTLGAIATYRTEAYLRSEILAYLAGIGWLSLLIWLLDDKSQWMICVQWCGYFVLGKILVLWWYRHGTQFADRLRSRLTLQSTLVREGRTDVRTVATLLPPPQQEYDPRDYFSHGQFFLGLDQDGQAIYWRERFPHVMVAGTSGSGKGRKLQDLSAQALANGEALVYLDPKDDEWGPHALYAACQAAQQTYHFLSLLPESPAQINIVSGAKAWEIEELLTVALDLGDKGKGSDFYKAKDRAAARHAAELAATAGLTLAEVYRRMAQDDYWRQESPGFLDKLGELAGLKAIHATGGGVSLACLIHDGGALYVVGSMTIQAVRRAQQMIFVRIQQIASARNRMAGALRIVNVIADEAKYHVSRPILQGLGASRDKGMRVVLAFQSFMDLRDCPADMDPDAVVGAVVENTPVKLIYRLEDPDTADWLARKSGTILVDDETRQLGRNVVLTEITENGRSVRQAEHFLIDSNKLTNLPAGWAVLYGHGLAQPCYISPYRIEKRAEAIAIQAAESRTSDVGEVLTDPIEKRPRKSTRDSSFFAMEGSD